MKYTEQEEHSMRNAQNVDSEKKINDYVVKTAPLAVFKVFDPTSQ